MGKRMTMSARERARTTGIQPEARTRVEIETFGESCIRALEPMTDQAKAKLRRVAGQGIHIDGEAVFYGTP